MSTSQQVEPVLTPNQRKRPLSIIEENESDSDNDVIDNAKSSDVSEEYVEIENIPANHEVFDFETEDQKVRDDSRPKEKPNRAKALIADIENGRIGQHKTKVAPNRPQVAPKTSTTRKQSGGVTSTDPKRNVKSPPPAAGPKSPTSPTSPSSISKTKVLANTCPLAPKTKPSPLRISPNKITNNSSKSIKGKGPQSPLSPTSEQGPKSPSHTSRSGSGGRSVTSPTEPKSKQSRELAPSPKRTGIPTRVKKTKDSPLAAKSNDKAPNKAPKEQEKTSTNETEVSEKGAESENHVPLAPPSAHPPIPGDGHGLKRIRETAQRLNLGQSSSVLNSSITPNNAPALSFTSSTTSLSHSPKFGHKLKLNPPSNQPSHDTAPTAPSICISPGTPDPPSSVKQDSPPMLNSSQNISNNDNITDAQAGDNSAEANEIKAEILKETAKRLSPLLSRRDYHKSPQMTTRFSHSKLGQRFLRRLSTDANTTSISEESEIPSGSRSNSFSAYSTFNSNTLNGSSINNSNSNINDDNNNVSNNNSNNQNSIGHYGNNMNHSAPFFPLSPDFQQLQETAHRLHLSTRRPSTLQWRQKYLDNAGISRSRPDLNGDVIDERLTSDRKQRINDALEWLRNELHDMRSQDQLLARQLLSIRHDIHQLKLRRSTEEHQDLLDDFQCEMEELQDLQEVSDVLDLQEPPMIGINPLKHVGVTRLNLSARRFSAC